jgi:hypothetical protein
MKKKSSKQITAQRLRLGKDTVAHLSHDMLELVAGGARPTESCLSCLLAARPPSRA